MILFYFPVYRLNREIFGYSVTLLIFNSLLVTKFGYGAKFGYDVQV